MSSEAGLDDWDTLELAIQLTKSIRNLLSDESHPDEPYGSKSAKEYHVGVNNHSLEWLHFLKMHLRAPFSTDVFSNQQFIENLQEFIKFTKVADSGLSSDHMLFFLGLLHSIYRFGKNGVDSSRTLIQRHVILKCMECCLEVSLCLIERTEDFSVLLEGIHVLKSMFSDVESSEFKISFPIDVDFTTVSVDPVLLHQYMSKDRVSIFKFATSTNLDYSRAKNPASHLDIDIAKNSQISSLYDLFDCSEVEIFAVSNDSLAIHFALKHNGFSRLLSRCLTLLEYSISACKKSSSIHPLVQSMKSVKAILDFCFLVQNFASGHIVSENEIRVLLVCYETFVEYLNILSFYAVSGSQDLSEMIGVCKSFSSLIDSFCSSAGFAFQVDFELVFALRIINSFWNKSNLDIENIAKYMFPPSDQLRGLPFYRFHNIGDVGSSISAAKFQASLFFPLIEYAIESILCYVDSSTSHENTSPEQISYFSDKQHPFIMVIDEVKLHCMEKTPRLSLFELMFGNKEPISNNFWIKILLALFLSHHERFSSAATTECSQFSALELFRKLLNLAQTFIGSCDENIILSSPTLSFGKLQFNVLLSFCLSPGSKWILEASTIENFWNFLDLLVHKEFISISSLSHALQLLSIETEEWSFDLPDTLLFFFIVLLVSNHSKESEDAKRMIFSKFWHALVLPSGNRQKLESLLRHLGFTILLFQSSSKEIRRSYLNCIIESVLRNQHRISSFSTSSSLTDSFVTILLELLCFTLYEHGVLKTLSSNSIKSFFEIPIFPDSKPEIEKLFSLLNSLSQSKGPHPSFSIELDISTAKKLFQFLWTRLLEVSSLIERGPYSSNNSSQFRTISSILCMPPFLASSREKFYKETSSTLALLVSSPISILFTKICAVDVLNSSHTLLSNSIMWLMDLLNTSKGMFSNLEHGSSEFPWWITVALDMGMNVLNYQLSKGLLSVDLKKSHVKELQDLSLILYPLALDLLENSTGLFRQFIRALLSEQMAKSWGGVDYTEILHLLLLGQEYGLAISNNMVEDNLKLIECDSESYRLLCQRKDVENLTKQVFERHVSHGNVESLTGKVSSLSQIVQSCYSVISSLLLLDHLNITIPLVHYTREYTISFLMELSSSAFLYFLDPTIEDCLLFCREQSRSVLASAQFVKYEKIDSIFASICANLQQISQSSWLLLRDVVLDGCSSIISMLNLTGFCEKVFLPPESTGSNEIQLSYFLKTLGRIMSISTYVLVDEEYRERILAVLLRLLVRAVNVEMKLGENHIFLFLQDTLSNARNEVTICLFDVLSGKLKVSTDSLRCVVSLIDALAIPTQLHPRKDGFTLTILEFVFKILSSMSSRDFINCELLYHLIVMYLRCSKYYGNFSNHLIRLISRLNSLFSMSPPLQCTFLEAFLNVFSCSEMDGHSLCLLSENGLLNTSDPILGFRCFTCESSSKEKLGIQATLGNSPKFCSNCYNICHFGHDVMISSKFAGACECNNSECRVHSSFTNDNNNDYIQVSDIVQRDVILSALRMIKPCIDKLCQLLCENYKDGILNGSNNNLQTFANVSFRIVDVYRFKLTHRLSGPEVSKALSESRKIVFDLNLYSNLISILGHDQLVLADGFHLYLYDISSLREDILNVNDLNTIEKSSPSSYLFFPFPIVSISNSTSSTRIAVVGSRECHVLELNSFGLCIKRYVLELSLDELDVAYGSSIYIIKAMFLPGSKNILVICTNIFIKVFDIDEDLIVPKQTILSQDHISIVDFALAYDKLNADSIYLFVFLKNGTVCNVDGFVDFTKDQLNLINIVWIPENQVTSDPVSLYYSSSMKVLFAAFSSSTLIFTLSGNAIIDSTFLCQVGDGIMEKGPYRSSINQFIDCKGDLNAVFCVSRHSKINVIRIIDGVPVIFPLKSLPTRMNSMIDASFSFSVPMMLIFRDDKVLQCIENSRFHNIATKNSFSVPHYPSFINPGKFYPSIQTLDFYDRNLSIFERSSCSSNWRVSSQNTSISSNGIKKLLNPDDSGFVPSDEKQGFALTFSFDGDSQYQIFCGIRILLGRSMSSLAIPSYISICSLGIRIETESNTERFYDIPFSIEDMRRLWNSEKKLLTVFFGPAFNGEMYPVVDGIILHTLDLQNAAKKSVAGEGLILPCDKIFPSANSFTMNHSLWFCISFLKQILQISRSLNSSSVIQMLSGCKNTVFSLYKNCNFEEFDVELSKDIAEMILYEYSIPKDLFSISRFPGVLVLFNSCNVDFDTFSLHQEKYLYAVSKIITVLESSELSAIAFEFFMKNSFMIDNLISLCMLLLSPSKAYSSEFSSTGISLVLHLILNFELAYGVDDVSHYYTSLLRAALTSPIWSVSQMIFDVFCTPLNFFDVQEGLFCLSKIQGVNHQSMEDHSYHAGDEENLKYRCDICDCCPIPQGRWHCTDEACPDFDLCLKCKVGGDFSGTSHSQSHKMEYFGSDEKEFVSSDYVDLKEPSLLDRFLVPEGLDPKDDSKIAELALKLSLQESLSFKFFKNVKSNSVPKLREGIIKRIISEMVNVLTDENNFEMINIPFLRLLFGCCLSSLDWFEGIEALLLGLFHAYKSLTEHLQDSLSQAALKKIWALLSFIVSLNEAFMVYTKSTENSVKEFTARVFGTESEIHDILNILCTLCVSNINRLDYSSKQTLITQVDIVFKILNTCKSTDVSISISKFPKCALFVKFLLKILKSSLPNIDLTVIQLIERLNIEHREPFLRGFFDVLVSEIENFVKDTFQLETDYAMQVSLFDSLQVLERLSEIFPLNFGDFMMNQRSNPLICFLSATFTLPLDFRSPLLKIICNALTIQSSGLCNFLEFACKHDLIYSIIENHLICHLDKIHKPASVLLLFIWNNSSLEQKQILITTLSQWIHHIPMLGSNGAQLLTTMGYFLMELPEDHDRSPYLFAACESLRNCVNTLKLSEDLAFYLNMKSNFPSVQSSCFLSDACYFCCLPTDDFKIRRIQDIESQSKFSHNACMIELNDVYAIRSFTFNIKGKTMDKAIKTIEIHFNNDPEDTISSLKESRKKWIHATTENLLFGAKSFRVALPVEITAANVMIVFNDFYPSQGGKERALICPRCHSVVLNRHGICSSCRENAYQCRNCRNINYEHLDAFMCNECGFSKYAQVEISIDSAPSFRSIRVSTESQKESFLNMLSSHTENSRKLIDEIQGFRRDFENIDRKMRSKSNRSVEKTKLYTQKCLKISKKCDETFRRLCVVNHSLIEIRKSLGLALKLSGNQPNLSTLTCFRCVLSSVDLIVQFINDGIRCKTISIPFISGTDLIDLSLQVLKLCDDGLSNLIISLLESLSAADALVASAIDQRISSELRLVISNPQTDYLWISRLIFLWIEKLLNIEQNGIHVFEARLKSVMNMLFYAVKHGINDFKVSHEIILPILDKINSILKCPHEKSFSEFASKEVYMDIDTEIGDRVTPSTSSILFSAWSSTSILLLDRPELEMSDDECALNSYQRCIARRAVNKWRSSLLKTRGIETRFSSCWIYSIVFSEVSVSVRTAGITLLKNLSIQGTDHLLYVLKFLVENMNVLLDKPKIANLYFELAIELASNESEFPNSKEILVQIGVLQVLVYAIKSEAIKLSNAEKNPLIELRRPSILVGATNLLGVLLIRQRHIQRRFKRHLLVGDVLDAFLHLRSLTICRSKDSQDCASILMKVVEDSHSANDEDRQSLIRIYVQVLKCIEGYSNRTPHFVLEQLHRLVNPETRVEPFQIILKKAFTQEEFIRGSIKNNPFSSDDLGVSLPQMRHLKDRIVEELELHDAENMFELLVDNKIISLDLPIAKVYEKIWKPTLSRESGYFNEDGFDDSALLDYDVYSDMEMDDIDDSAMIVVYRLQGLDGEATEDVVETLPDDIEQNPEIKFGLSRELLECGALNIFTDMLAALKDGSHQLDSKTTDLIYDNLLISSKLRINRRFFQSMHFHFFEVHARLVILHLSIRNHELLEKILTFIENVLRDMEVVEFQIHSEQVVFLHDCIIKILSHLPDLFGKHEIMGKLMFLLMYLSFGRLDLISLIFSSFKNGCGMPTDLDVLDSDSSSLRAHKNYFESFAVFSETLLSFPFVRSIQDFFLQSGIVQCYTDYIRSIATASPCGLEDKENFKHYIGKICALPYVLRILRGLCKTHSESQSLLLSNRIIPFLHSIESLSTDNKIGPLSESLLDILKDDEKVASVISDLRGQRKINRKALAMQKRNKMLRKLGIRESKKTNSSGPMLKADRNLDGLENLDEVIGLKCMVCQEGYSSKPKELLGLYVFNREVYLSLENGEECLTSTVTHFNTIHFKCHRDAAIADRALKQPKTEWDGATIRNAHTLCNNLIPIWNVSNDIQDYESRIGDYWQAISFKDNLRLPYSVLVTHDLRQILEIFSKGESFSTYSKGGGRESNIRLIPYLIQMGVRLLLRNGSAERLKRLNQVSSWLEELNSCQPSKRLAVEIDYLAVECLFVCPNSQWSSFRLRILESILRARDTVDLATSLCTDDELPRDILSNVYYWVLLDRISALLDRYIRKSVESSDFGLAYLEDLERMLPIHHEDLLKDLGELLPEFLQIMNTSKTIIGVAETLGVRLDELLR